MGHFQLPIKTQLLESVSEEEKIGTHRKTFLTVGLTALLVLGGENAFSFPPLCDQSRKIMSNIVEDELEAAHKLSMECEANIEAHQEDNFGPSLLRAQYFVTSQILALQGSFPDAELRRQKALTLFATDLFLWGTLEDGAVGLLLEKKGDIEQAQNWYRNHHSTMASTSLARLAVLYLAQSKEQEAKGAANLILFSEPHNPTAQIVLAALLEKSNPRKALENYQTALQRLRSVSSPDTEFSAAPIYYAEGPRAISAIQRLRAALRMPTQ